MLTNPVCQHGASVAVLLFFIVLAGAMGGAVHVSTPLFGTIAPNGRAYFRRPFRTRITNKVEVWSSDRVEFSDHVNFLQVDLRRGQGQSANNLPTSAPRALGQRENMVATYDWNKANRRFFRTPPSRLGVEETLWSNGERDRPCGSPCVAHCIAGQPRDFVRVPGLRKSIRHRLIDRFSESPVTFGVLVASAFHGTLSHKEGEANFVRTDVNEVSNEDLLLGVMEVGIDRALIIRENCTSPECMTQSGLALTCDAKKLGLTAQFDEAHGMVSNFCRVQLSRLSSCMNLVRQYEGDHQIGFAWVTRVRPDVYWTRPSPAAHQLNPDIAYVTPWASCGYGGMDWFYALPRSSADKVAKFTKESSCDTVSHESTLKTCRSCLGCECFLAGFLRQQGVQFSRLPWSWHAPSKFCGSACPYDWEVNESSILCGREDPRCMSEPCKMTNGVFVCPP